VDGLGHVLDADDHIHFSMDGWGPREQMNNTE